MASKADLTVVQQTAPVVGFRDEFERNLFSPVHNFGGLNPKYEAWREKMLELMGDPAEREQRMWEMCIPIKSAEPSADGQISRAIGDMLRPIGAKIAPHLSGEQATAWRKAVVMALGDLPAHVVVEVLPLAIHKPMRFLSDVETEIRRLANTEITRMNNAVAALADLTNGRRWRVPPAIETEPEIGI